MDAMQILVIILSVFLAIFLVLGIILTILLIRVTLQIKEVTTTAQHAADKLEAFAAQAGRIATPALLGKTLLGLVKKLKK